MPYVHLSTNMDLNDTQRAATAAKLSAKVSILLGKAEQWVMVRVDADQTMIFGGSDDPAAFLALDSLGLTDEQCPELAAELAKTLYNELKLDPQRVFMSFGSPPKPRFAWNGKTFG